MTALGDRELAISHVVHSAFSHSGQKCSATSLLLVEEEVYRDSRFRETLCDAVRSLEVGSAWDLHTSMGPLIRAPSGVLETGLKELEPGESWAVMPRRLEDNPCLYSPGIKWDVRPGSFTHLTELFGPVLGVMEVKNLDQALDLIRQTGYGLTSGLESLDDREQSYWCDRVEAGNLYINRGTTGAIVLRQPFGGMGKSAFGPGIKAGGPNYVAQLMDFRDGEVGAGALEIADPDLADLRWRLQQPSPPGVAADGDDLLRVAAALESYCANSQVEFGRTHDHFRLVGQDNLRRYLPVRRLHIRLDPLDSLFEIFARVCAAKAVGCRATLSCPRGWWSPATDWLQELTASWNEGVEFLEGNRRRAGEPGPRSRDRPRPLFGAGAGAGDRVPGGGRVRGLLGASPRPDPGPGGVALVFEGAKHQCRLPSLRQLEHPGGRRRNGGLVARISPVYQTKVE